MTFQFNDRVVVDGRRGRFIEYTPNGSARVFLNERDDLLVEPERVNLIMTNTNTTTAYGKLIKEDMAGFGGGRRHGASKTIHRLVIHTDGRIETPCAPGSIGLPAERYTQADITCKRCRNMIG